MSDYTSSETDEPSGNISRLIVHGFAILVVLQIVGVLTGIASILGGIVGSIIAFAGLFVVAGFVNVFVSDYLWQIKNGRSIVAILVHGFTLVVCVAIIDIPRFLIYILFDYDPMSSDVLQTVGVVLLLLIYTPFYGHAAKVVAAGFSDHAESFGRIKSKAPVDNYVTEEGVYAKCPYCGISEPYHKQDVSSDGVALCRECGETIIMQRQKLARPFEHDSFF